MKRILLVFVSAACLGLVSCKDEEPKVDPIVGKWELDEAITDGSDAAYSFYYGSANSVYGEDSYLFEFKADLTYERDIDNIPGFGDVNEDGEYEKTATDLDLDPSDEIQGLASSFEIVELTATTLILKFIEEDVAVFPNTILADEVALDTISSQESFDKFFAEYGAYIDLEITMELDKL